MRDLEAFLLDWGYVVVFAAPLLENAGLPVPGDSALFWLAYLSAQGGLRLDLRIGLAMVGAVLGDNLGYWAGRRGGRPLIERLGRRWPVAARALGRTERFFARHGALTIFVGRFVPGLRVFAALVAGAALMGWGRFFGRTARARWPGRRRQVWRAGRWDIRCRGCARSRTTPGWPRSPRRR